MKFKKSEFATLVHMVLYATVFLNIPWICNSLEKGLEASIESSRSHFTYPHVLWTVGHQVSTHFKASWFFHFYLHTVNLFESMPSKKAWKTLLTSQLPLLWSWPFAMKRVPGRCRSVEPPYRNKLLVNTQIFNQWKIVFSWFWSVINFIW
jgi:hypothetical protein